MHYNEQFLKDRGFICDAQGVWRKPKARKPTTTQHPWTPAKLESNPGDGTLVAPQAEITDSRKFLVRITSFRKRLLDQDNLCEKYHVDCCRYAGIIPGDEPGKTRIEVSQEKVSKGEAEFTRVEVFETE